MLNSRAYIKIRLLRTAYKEGPSGLSPNNTPSTMLSLHKGHGTLTTRALQPPPLPPKHSTPSHHLTPPQQPLTSGAESLGHDLAQFGDRLGNGLHEDSKEGRRQPVAQNALHKQPDRAHVDPRTEGLNRWDQTMC